MGGRPSQGVTGQGSRTMALVYFLEFTETLEPQAAWAPSWSQVPAAVCLTGQLTTSWIWAWGRHCSATGGIRTSPSLLLSGPRAPHTEADTVLWTPGCHPGCTYPTAQPGPGPTCARP